MHLGHIQNICRYHIVRTTDPLRPSLKEEYYLIHGVSITTLHSHDIATSPLGYVVYIVFVRGRHRESRSEARVLGCSAIMIPFVLLSINAEGLLVDAAE